MKNVVFGIVAGVVVASNAMAMDVGYGEGQVDPRLAAAVEAQQVDVYPDAVIRIAEAQARAEAAEFYVDAVVREAIKQGKAFIGDDGKVYSVGYGEGQVDPSFVK